jgi:hypothetical protein
MDIQPRFMRGQKRNVRAVRRYLEIRFFGISEKISQGYVLHDLYIKRSQNNRKYPPMYGIQQSRGAAEKVEYIESGFHPTYIL